MHAVHGTEIVLDVPLTDSLDASNSIMTPIQLMPYEPPVFASEIGIENLSMIIKPKCSGIPLRFNNHIDIEKFASRTTVTCVVMNRDGVTDRGAGYALDIDIGGSQVLIHNCTTRGAKNAKSYGVATKTLAAGPNACIGYTAMDPIESIQPHQRWAHGFLNEGSNGRGIAVQESW
ncbi:hypothetical protein BM1_04749 [Bipolaris maydis]|nr:hypothetical protein BM1_04749 [Bipolaris maydis]